MAKRRGDPKEEALRAARALNPRPDAVTDEAFAASEFLDSRDLIQVRYEMVRRVRVDGESVSAAASGFGFSRPSWYAAAAALDEGGLPALLRARPGPRRAHKLTAEVVSYLTACPWPCKSTHRWPQPGTHWWPCRSTHLPLTVSA